MKKKIAILSLSICTFLCLCGCDSTEKDYNSAQKLFESGEYKEALELYSQIVKERIEDGANEKAALRLFSNCPFVCINFDFSWLNKVRPVSFHIWSFNLLAFAQSLT